MQDKNNFVQTEKNDYFCNRETNKIHIRMKEQKEEKNLEVSDVITRTGAYIEKNKKVLTIVGCGVVVLALAIWAIFGWYINPRQNRAAEDMYAAEQWFANGEYEKALNGNEEFLGFLQVIDQYGGTRSANLAKYCAGVCHINLGQFNEAIDLLKGYKGKDTFTEAEAQMLIGDAYAELDNAAEAVNYYTKAAKASDNVLTAPTALWKAGMMYLKQDKKKEALKCFKEVKDKYNESTEWSDIDKYIAYAEN